MPLCLYDSTPHNSPKLFFRRFRQINPLFPLIKSPHIGAMFLRAHFGAFRRVFVRFAVQFRRTPFRAFEGGIITYETMAILSVLKHLCSYRKWMPAAIVPKIYLDVLILLRIGIRGLHKRCSIIIASAVIILGGYIYASTDSRRGRARFVSPTKVTESLPDIAVVWIYIYSICRCSAIVGAVPMNIVSVYHMNA